MSLKEKLSALKRWLLIGSGAIAILCASAVGVHFALQEHSKPASEHGDGQGAEGSGEAHPVAGHGDGHHPKGSSQHHASADEAAHEGHGSGEHAASAGQTGGFFSVIYHALVSTQHKADEIKRASLENERLRLENMNLRKWGEQIRFECTASEAERGTKLRSTKLSEETGVRVGRILASIPYQPPAHLLPPQLHTLAVAYLKAGENEKAAVIFTFLTGMEDNEPFRTSRNYLMTAVSWYRLDHLQLADQYLDLAIQSQEEDEAAYPYQAQARLWRAVVAERLKDHRRSQKWLKELVDHHPKSVEASWVNPNAETARVPAGRKAHKKAADHHGEGKHENPSH